MVAPTRAKSGPLRLPGVTGVAGPGNRPGQRTPHRAPAPRRAHRPRLYSARLRRRAVLCRSSVAGAKVAAAGDADAQEGGSVRRCRGTRASVAHQGGERMVARIVLVHGAFNELWGPNELKARWVPALQDGLWHCQVEIDSDDVGV